MTALNAVGTCIRCNWMLISQAVALGTSQLRVQNAPTLDNGNYIAVIDPAMQNMLLNEQVALAGGSAASWFFI